MPDWLVDLVFVVGPSLLVWLGHWLASHRPPNPSDREQQR